MKNDLERISKLEKEISRLKKRVAHLEKWEEEDEQTLLEKNTNQYMTIEEQLKEISKLKDGIRELKRWIKWQ